MIRVSIRSRVLILMGLVLGLAFNRMGLADETLTLQGANPRLFLHDTDGTQQSWDITGTTSAFSIGNNFETNIRFYIYPNAKEYGIVSGVNGVGFGVEPQRNLHVYDEVNIPTLRLQDAASHAWDLEGNPSGFKLVDDPSGVNRTTFRVNSGAPADSLAVSGNGDVGMGLNNPQARLHVFPQNNLNANIRLETPAAGGGGPPNQAWDLAGNAGGFSLVDITGFKTPFSVAPATPTYTMHLAANGSVGMGTPTPDANSKVDIRSSQLNGLFVKRTTAGPSYLRVEDSTGSTFRCGVQGNGDTQFGAITPGKGLALVAGGTGKLAINASGQLSFGSSVPANPSGHAVIHSSGAHLTTGGVWTSVSSRAAKQDIEPITSAEARETVRALQPVGYRYKSELDEHYVGFIAEDVPELVATRDRKGLAPMDITAVLTKVVQDQDKLLTAQQTKLDAQQLKLEKLEKQEALIAALTERLEALERANAVAPERD